MFLERIYSLLAEKGVSKNKMLTELDLSKNSFVNWETRNTVPNGDALVKIASYFGVSVDYLLGNSDTKKEPSAELSEELQELLKNPRIRAAFDLLVKMNDQQLDVALAQVKALSLLQGNQDM